MQSRLVKKTGLKERSDVAVASGYGSCKKNMAGGSSAQKGIIMIIS